MPPKRKTINKNEQSSNPKRKTKESVGSKKTTTSKTSNKQSLKSKKQVYTVMHVKTAGFKQYKTANEAKKYLKDQQETFGKKAFEDWQYCEFEDLQALTKACDTIKKSHVQIPADKSSLDQALNSKFGLPTKQEDTKLSPANLTSKQKDTKRQSTIKQIAETKSVFFSSSPISTSNAGQSTSDQKNTQKLAENLNMLYHSTGNKFELSILPPIFSASNKQSYQVFAIDLISNKTNNTIWTHKPSVWEAVFNMDKTLPEEQGGQNINDEFFYHLRHASKREKSTGPNVPKQITTNTGKVVYSQILWSMVECSENTEETLKNKCNEIQRVGFKSCYTRSISYNHATYWIYFCSFTRPSCTSSKTKHPFFKRG